MVGENYLFHFCSNLLVMFFSFGGAKGGGKEGDTFNILSS